MSESEQLVPRYYQRWASQKPGTFSRSFRLGVNVRVPPSHGRGSQFLRFPSSQEL